jgi:Ca-activated chloride channel family protein
VQPVPVHEGRAVFLGEQAGFYQLTAGEQQTQFAANLLDRSESAIAPRATLSVDGQPAGQVAGFRVGVRREIWIYLLLAVALLTALEWATYHRRLTV